MSKVVFLCGTPRSGSTLLANLLAQNPNVHASASSGLRDTLLAVKRVCDDNEFYRAMPPEDRHMRKLMVLRGVVQGYYSHIDPKIRFDKNRGWPTSFEMMEWIIGSREGVKAIVCVRDLRDVLASFEKLYRKTAASAGVPELHEHLTAQGRAEFVLRHDKPLGLAMSVIRDAVTRGWRKNMLFVEYDALCTSTQFELNKIYRFIDEEPFEHNPDRVEQVTKEDDSVHGFSGLHDIRPKVKPQGPQWEKVFDDAVLRTPFWARVDRSARFWEGM